MQLPLRAWALQAVLEYFKQFYGNPPIYIHEKCFSLSLKYVLVVLH